jgi:adenosylcobinamide kinase / adenosylcobinamide-phosphate guanylyltransferase
MTLDLTLLLGGVRAGKSRAALGIAESCRRGGRALFVATAEARDDEMHRRIEAHRRERGDEWETLEEPLELAHAIDARLSRDDDLPAVVVIDCLTLWVSNVVLSLERAEDSEPELAARTAALLSVIQRHSAVERAHNAAIDRRWVVVSNEVGLGVVPPTTLGRHFRDALGRTNQLVVECASRVSLMVAGLAVELKAPTRP